MRSRPVVALDLGSSKVACVVGQPREGGHGFEIMGLGLACYPLPTATWSSDPALMARTIEQALEEARVGQSLDRALVSLTHPELSHRRVTASIDVSDEPATIRRRDIQRLKAQALSQALGLDRNALLLESLGYTGNGFQAVKDPCGLAARRLTGAFQLVGIPLSLRRIMTQALEAAGLETEQLIYSPQALAAALLDEQMGSKRVLLIDIGGCCTDLAILDKGSLVRTHAIPWGGMAVAEAIAKECRLTLDTALPMSLEGLASPKPRLRKLIEQQLQVLQRSVRQLLKGEVLPELAIVTGRGALIDGVVEWVEEMTEIKAVLGRSPRAKDLGDLSRQVAFTPAIGLLELACRTPLQVSPKPSRLADRLLERTKTLLTEYF